MGWTFLVLVMIPIRRFSAAFAGEVTAQNFRYGETQDTPFTVQLPNRMFMNLLEVPVLFYALCLMLYVSNHVDAVFVTLCWVYLGFRILHSVIYLTYNHVIHRFFIFAISNLLVVAIWLRFVLMLIG